MDRKDALSLIRKYKENWINEIQEAIETLIPELHESEDERTRKEIIEFIRSQIEDGNSVGWDRWIAYLEKQKENPKSSDSIPSDCVSDAKLEDRWHKVADSLPDNGRLVLAQDCLGNRLLARYDGEGNWEVSVYDNNDYYCRNTITKWCEIPSEKQKEQKPAEWRDEVEHRITDAIPFLESAKILYADTSEIDKTIDGLKSLLPSWKPSEEQIKQLNK